MRQSWTNVIAPFCGPGLARLFSASVIRELADCGRSVLGTRILSDLRLAPELDPSLSLAEFYDAAQTALFRVYRSEYVYKNANVPVSLKAAALSCALTGTQQRRLVGVLHTDIGQCLLST